MSIGRLTLLLIVAASLCGFTDQDIEKARQWSHKTLDAFRTCLQTEIEGKLSLRMTSADFVVYLKGACSQEAQAFRVPFVDYLAMKFPDIPAKTHLEQAEAAIGQWRDAAAKLYVESLYQRK